MRVCDFFSREEIEAAKTLLFGLSAGGGVNARGSSSFQSIPSTTLKSFTPVQSSQSVVAAVPSTSQLNSDRAGSESHSEGGDSEEEEDLGFGDSNYFHDNKYGEKLDRL